MVKFITEFRMRCLKLLSLMKPVNFKKEKYRFMEGDSAVWWNSDFDNEVEQLVERWLDLKKEIRENYSYTFLEEEIKKNLFGLKFNTNPNKVPDIDNFFKKYNTNILKKLSTFVIPQFIENFSIKEKIKFTIGNIEFIPFSEKNYRSIFINLGYKGSSINLDQNVLKNVTYIAINEVTAMDETKALEKSDSLIEQALNVIRLIDTYPNFGIIGKYNQPRLQTVYMWKKETKTLRNSIHWAYHIKPSSFSKETYDNFKNKYGIDNIDNILKKENHKRTDMENKLLLSIYWFGEILKNTNLNENLIRLFTAFETLLLFDRNEQKKPNIAKRLAYINYPTDNNCKEEIEKFIQKLYDARSNIVHNGKARFKETDYYILRYELRKCILNIAKKIDKYQDVKSWLVQIPPLKTTSKFMFYINFFLKFGEFHTFKSSKKLEL